ncbi:MAG: M20 family metallopeptidase [Usitatibacter sp.]
MLPGSTQEAGRIDTEALLAGIREWVEIETPSTDAVAVNTLVALVASQFACLGMDVQRVAGRDGRGDHLLARSPWGQGKPGILVLGHLDTVWPIGTLARRPLRLEADKAFGPGTYDMKAGDYVGFAAYRHLVDQGKTTPLAVTFLFVSDEEVGSPTSRELIEEIARRSRYVLVMEPGRPAGAVVTSRKAIAKFVVTIKGVAAHAGVAHEQGRSAVVELAHQILCLEALTDHARGITVSVGVIAGGNKGFSNVVPEHAEAYVDCRAVDATGMEHLVRSVKGLSPKGRDVTVTVTGGVTRPAFERTSGVAALYDHAREVARELGQDLPEVATGGGSDGNFTAALGIPTLDGLGAVGAGAHAEHEHILLSSLRPRVELVSRLMETLE